MPSSTRTKLLFILAGVILGGLLVGAYGYVRMLATRHHYSELETFFRGNVWGKEVLGIAYLDYHGLGFMERTQWKIELRDHQGQSIVIYQNRSVFQESTPHTPKIEIKDEQIWIDDGENKLMISSDPKPSDHSIKE